MNRVMTGYHFGTPAVKKQTAYTKLDFIKTKLLIKLLVLGGFVVALALFYTWSRVQIVQLGYEINELKIEHQNLMDQNKRLTMEISLVKSPENLRNTVSQKLGMELPKLGQIVEIK